jgi:sporulation protein YlmC with PRC-barrel domain
VVEIYEKSGKIFGKVRDFDVNHRKARCVDCEGEDTNK